MRNASLTLKWRNEEVDIRFCSGDFDAGKSGHDTKSRCWAEAIRLFSIRFVGGFIRASRSSVE